jgi:DNA-binding transcriptional ArsR family regulator
MTDADLDETLLALADPTRRRVVDLLRKTPQRAGDLAEALSISPPRLSRHLRVLRKCGLIEDGGLEQDARVSLYHLRPERFARLRTWLDEVEQFWTTQLAAFKTHVEGTRPRGGSRAASSRPPTGSGHSAARHRRTVARDKAARAVVGDQTARDQAARDGTSREEAARDKKPETSQARRRRP